MKLHFYLTAFGRSKGDFISKQRIALDEKLICDVLALSAGTDLAGEFAIDVEAARRLRKQGVKLDLRKHQYFLGSEASNDDVRKAIDALSAVPNLRTAQRSSNRGTKTEIGVKGRQMPIFTRRVDLGTLATAGGMTRPKAAAAKKANVRKAPAKKSAFKKVTKKKTA